jgi:hypothetical protein
MAAGLVLPISGPYLGVFHAFPLGTLSDDGYELSCTIAGQEVNETDSYGLTLVEAIYRGQNWRCRIRGMEWDKTGLLESLQTFGRVGASGSRSFNPILSQIGQRWTNFAFPLLLTAILADPPSFPATLTAVNATFAPNTQTLFNLTSKLREFPIEYALIPYTQVIASVSYAIPFSTT